MNNSEQLNTEEWEIIREAVYLRLITTREAEVQFDNVKIAIEKFISKAITNEREKCEKENIGKFSGIVEGIKMERERIVDIIESIQSTENNSFSFALEQFKKILINQINKD